MASERRRSSLAMRTTEGEATFTKSVRAPEATARVTAAAGMVLFVMLAVQGVTILRIRGLITAHFFVGFLLLGPVLLKLGSTGYRFLRYYTGDAEYVAAGPPRLLLRIAAPLLVITTLTVFGSGVVLAFVRPSSAHVVVQIHKASFIAWFGVTALHVLAYLWRATELTADDVAGRGDAAVVARRRTRAALVVGSIVVGLVIAVIGVGTAHQWVVWFGSRGGGH
jgi:hypothetical protein